MRHSIYMGLAQLAYSEGKRNKAPYHEIDSTASGPFSHDCCFYGISWEASLLQTSSSIRDVKRGVA
jgi:hypothetical protein